MDGAHLGPHNTRLHSELTPKDSPFLNHGVLLENRWHIEGMLNVGGFGQVFLGVDSSTGREVAVKVESTRASVSLLHNEADCLRELNVAQGYVGIDSAAPVVHFFSSGQNELVRFMVMDLVGRNVRELKKNTREDRFSLRTSLWVMREMMMALEFVHKAGWIHRDVKPPNFCLFRCGVRRLFLVDFGMSRKFVKADGTLKEREKQAPFYGTVRYASPRCHAGKDVSRWDDLWSLFYIVCENVMGAIPWRHSSDKMEVMKMKEAIDLLAPQFWQRDRPPNSISSLRTALTEADSNDSSFYTQPPYNSFTHNITSDLECIGWIEGVSPLDWDSSPSRMAGDSSVYSSPFPSPHLATSQPSFYLI